MRHTLILAAMLGCFALPATAAEPPVGQYMCHDNGGGAIGLFSITGPGTYAWQSTATADFKVFKDDPSNGPGTYTLRADGWMDFEGAFADQWNVVGTWEEGWVWFSNAYGGVMRCGTVLSG